MRRRWLTSLSLVVAATAVTVVALIQVPAAGQTPPAKKAAAWTPPRVPWGDPDIAGIFTTDDDLGVPFERPEQFAGRELVTDEEFAQRATQLQRQADADAEEFVAPRPGANPEGGGGTGPPS